MMNSKVPLVMKSQLLIPVLLIARAQSLLYLIQLSLKKRLIWLCTLLNIFKSKGKYMNRYFVAKSKDLLHCSAVVKRLLFLIRELSHTHTHVRKHAHVHTHIHMQICAHTCKHPHTHTHTHTHTIVITTTTSNLHLYKWSRDYVTETHGWSQGSPLASTIASEQNLNTQIIELPWSSGFFYCGSQ